jgi:predicted membrane protein
MVGYNSNSWTYVGKDFKPSTGIGIPTDTCVCLDVNTHMGTLDYFISDKHIKDRVVNIPKDVYFGV